MRMQRRGEEGGWKCGNGRRRIEGNAEEKPKRGLEKNTEDEGVDGEECERTRKFEEGDEGGRIRC